VTAGAGCPFPLTPVCDAVGDATGGLAGDVLSAIVGWIVDGASWLLNQIGAAISSSTSIHLRASWFVVHYQTMMAIAAVVAVPMLLLSAVQAVYRQSPGILARAAFVHLPLAGLLTLVAIKLVVLSLAVTDTLCSVVSSSAGNDIARTLRGVAAVLVSQGGAPTIPTFVVALGALLVIAGALTVWLELIVRAAAVYVAVLFLPLALTSLVWPAVSQWCRRLVETLAALVLSKFVVVAVLSLAVGAVGSGNGFATVLTGGALLLLAAFTPFTLLRLVPMIEAGAALQLEGARQRVRQAWGSVPSSAASFALRQARQPAELLESPGTGTSIEPELPGTSGARSASGEATEGGANGGTPTGEGGFLPLGPLPPEATPGPSKIPPGPIWPADKEATAALLAAITYGAEPEPTGAGGIVPGVEMPLYGGNLPPSRFEPGPKDDWWTKDEELADLRAPGLSIRWATQRPRFPYAPPLDEDGEGEGGGTAW
jgi:hypothetical protein